jgi:hypothetical protein
MGVLMEALQADDFLPHGELFTPPSECIQYGSIPDDYQLLNGLFRDLVQCSFDKGQLASSLQSHTTPQTFLIA